MLTLYKVARTNRGKGLKIKRYSLWLYIKKIMVNHKHVQIKIIRQRNETCKMPALVAWASDDWPLTTTFWDLSVMKDVINEKSLPVILWLETLCCISLCHTLSKDVEISNAIVHEMCLLPRALTILLIMTAHQQWTESIEIRIAFCSRGS